MQGTKTSEPVWGGGGLQFCEKVWVRCKCGKKVQFDAEIGNVLTVNTLSYL